MRRPNNSRMIPLARGAQMMRVPYQFAHALVLRGELDGEFYLDKKWYVSLESIERYLAERCSPATSGGR
jgi:hypothetical protein